MLSAAELLRFRDKTVPDFLRDSDADGLLELETTLWCDCLNSEPEYLRTGILTHYAFVTL